MSDETKTVLIGFAVVLGIFLALVFGIPLVFHAMSAWDRFLTLHLGMI